MMKKPIHKIYELETQQNALMTMIISKSKEICLLSLWNIKLICTILYTISTIDFYLIIFHARIDVTTGSRNSEIKLNKT